MKAKLNTDNLSPVFSRHCFLGLSPSLTLRLPASFISLALRVSLAVAMYVCVEMVESMKKVATSDGELTVEERNLLSVAYKNVIGARRASWRIISSIEQKEDGKGSDAKVEMIKKYRNQVEKELRDICQDILDVLDKHLIASASTGESKVFYQKM